MKLSYQGVHGTKVHLLQQKFKLLKKDLKARNNQVFGNIFTKRQTLDMEKATIQDSILQYGLTDSLKSEEK